MHTTTRKILWLALKFTVTALLLWLALRSISLSSAVDQLQGARVMPLLLSALLLLAGNFAGAGSWLYLLRTQSPATSYRQAANWHWCGLFFNTFLPSTTGGDLIKGHMVYKAHGHPLMVIATLLADRLLNLAILILIGAAAGLFLLLPLQLALITTPLLLLPLWLAPYILRLTNRAIALLPAGRLHTLLASLLSPLLLLTSQPRLALPALAAALLSQLCKVLCHIPLALALALAIPSLKICALIPILGTVSALPITIGGLGLRELTAAACAAPLNLQSQELILLSLAAHLMVAITNLLGIIPLLRAKK